MYADSDDAELQFIEDERSWWKKHHKKIVIGLLVALVLAIGIAVIGFTTGGKTNQTDCNDDNNNATIPNGNFTTNVTVAKIKLHLQALEEIAMLPENHGSRAVDLGYNDSTKYIIAQLEPYKEFFTITQPGFTILSPKELSPSSFSQFSPNNVTYSNVTDFATMTYSGSGTVSRKPIHEAENLGCEAEDYQNVRNTIVLIQRGNCSFHQKAVTAANAGAIAALIYDPATEGMFHGTLGESVAIPVLSITSTLATQLKPIGGTGKFNLITNTTVLVSTTSNVIAESKDGLDNGTVIVIGSHLDSVPAGPGLNDNGSGSSSILAIAIEFAKWISPANKVRFAWWGAEELGLFGSAAYVQSLKNSSQLDQVALNLNFDMIASPNFIRGVYNGSSGKDDIREASIVIQKLFENHFHSVGLPFKLSDFNGRSDYGPFIENGIPAGGLDTGAEEKKTEAERKIFGGMANTPYDPCYHLSCDTIDNISEKALGDMSTAAAAVLERLATEKDLLKLLYPKGKSEQTIPSERTQAKRRGSFYYL